MGEMIDIVERLRVYNVRTVTCALRNEAADEIDRLRESERTMLHNAAAKQQIEIERLRTREHELLDQRMDQDKTIAGLRAALERIDSINDNPAIYNPDIDAVIVAALQPKE